MADSVQTVQETGRVASGNGRTTKLPGTDSRGRIVDTMAFLAARGSNPRMPVKAVMADGKTVRLKLDGVPASFDAAGLAKLASGQTCGATVKDAIAEGGVNAPFRCDLAGADAALVIKTSASIPTEGA